MVQKHLLEFADLIQRSELLAMIIAKTNKIRTGVLPVKFVAGK